MPPKTITDKVVLSIESQGLNELKQLREELLNIIKDIKREYKPPVQDVKEPFIQKLKKAIELNNEASERLEEACQLIGASSWDIATFPE